MRLEKTTWCVGWQHLRRYDISHVCMWWSCMCTCHDLCSHVLWVFAYLFLCGWGNTSAIKDIYCTCCMLTDWSVLVYVQYAHANHPTVGVITQGIAELHYQRRAYDKVCSVMFLFDWSTYTFDDIYTQHAWHWTSGMTHSVISCHILLVKYVVPP